MNRPPTPTPATRAFDSVRDPLVVQALEAALDGDVRALVGPLGRHSGLPGPRPNLAFAQAVAAHLAAMGPRSDRLVRALAQVDSTWAPAGTTAEFLPLCGALAQAARYRAGRDRRGALATLHAMAEDRRWLVREAVELSLKTIGGIDPDALAAELASWTDGYLHASVALDALTAQSLLDRLTTPDAVLDRLDEAFHLASSAPRSHERSQGWRTLVSALARASSAVLGRFGALAAERLAPHALTKVPELRQALAEGLHHARGARTGGDALDTVRQALVTSEPTVRDPRTIVGPTRGRGRKRAR